MHVTLVTSPNASAAYLRDARSVAGLGVDQAADIIGVSATSIERMERDGIPKRMRADSLARMCAAYNVSSDTVLELATTPA